ncbi:uncharacterized protein YkwD [Evansella vedderi]|uniref:Uncharacterized protein YkwD n=1 Tax=Evansella vedderi TaxID=38282 RepID=A0ABT9ZRI0_9BACI|nr:CAP domain-containing protein [Evansella vedderi]MDQ0253847.1 uncharacterized protein YkwD [Evansella vedderi]
MKIIITFIIGFLLCYTLLTFFYENEFVNEEIEELETASSPEETSDETDGNSQTDEDILNPTVHGIHEWIGKPGDDLVGEFGNPGRVDPTPYGYDWWIYNETDVYLQFALSMEDNTVVSVFTNDELAELPYIRIGDSYNSIAEQFEFNDIVSLSGEFSSYQFELREEELKMYPLAPLEDIWVQFYFDTVEDTLSSIRFIDQETLLLQRPYSIVYRGVLPEIEPLTDEQWEHIQEGQARQIFDLTNDIRKRHGLPPLKWEETTAKVALLHSQDMHYNNYFSHTSPTNGELKDRLQGEYLSFHSAAENIAANYVDGIAAVEGWLNSEGHRVNLLNDRFTHLGVGVYRNHYTQNFITPR